MKIPNEERFLRETVIPNLLQKLRTPDSRHADDENSGTEYQCKHASLTFPSYRPSSFERTDASNRDSPLSTDAQAYRRRGEEQTTGDNRQ